MTGPRRVYDGGVLAREETATLFELEPNRRMSWPLKEAAQATLLLMAHTDVVNVDPAKWSFRRSERSATAATCTAAGPSTIKTTSRRR